MAWAILLIFPENDFRMVLPPDLPEKVQLES
jgi:hypothetical protein